MCCSENSGMRCTESHLHANQPYYGRKDGVRVIGVKITGKITVSNSASKIQTIFQGIELLEKGAELADETFHLMNRVFKAYCSTPIFKLLSETHHAAHQLEHVFHSFCFLGDVYRFDKWVFNSKARHDTAYLYAASRVCHAVAHLLASLSFLSDLEIISGTYSSKTQHLVNMAGYGLGTIHLLKNKIEKKPNENFKSDLGIQLGGFVYESLTALNSYPTLNRLTALAGIIHAFSVVHRLLPSQQHLQINQFVKIDPSNPSNPSHNH
jgi:hypothetical protein